MPTETLGYVEMEWTCGKCGTRNRGMDRACVSCGAPMPADQKFERPAEGALIKDEAKVEAAKKGADIHCPFCSARNPADAKICHQCQGDLTKGQKREAGAVIGAHVEAKVEPVPCPSCSTPNAPDAARCISCGRPLGTATPITQPAAGPVAQPAAAAVPGSALMRWVGLAIGAGFLLLCVLAGIWYFTQTTTTTDMPATVSAVSWERIVAIEEQVRVTRSAWGDRVPDDGTIKQCELKPREMLSAPDPGRKSEKICGTPYEVDLGNGASEVRQDCQYQIYDDWCEYTQLDWQVADRVVASGSDLRPEWPALNLAAGQREGGRSETYVVVFSADSRQFEYSVADASAFAEFEPGSAWLLKVDGFGNIDALSPAR